MTNDMDRSQMAFRFASVADNGIEIKIDEYARELMAEWGEENALWARMRAAAAYGMGRPPKWTPDEPSKEWRKSAVYHYAMSRLVELPYRGRVHGV